MMEKGERRKRGGGGGEGGYLEAVDLKGYSLKMKEF